MKNIMAKSNRQDSISHHDDDDPDDKDEFDFEANSHQSSFSRSIATSVSSSSPAVSPSPSRTSLRSGTPSVSSLAMSSPQSIGSRRTKAQRQRVQEMERAKLRAANRELEEEGDEFDYDNALEGMEDHSKTVRFSLTSSHSEGSRASAASSVSSRRPTPRRMTAGSFQSQARVECE